MKFNYKKIIRSRFKFLLITLLFGIILGLILYNNLSIDYKTSINLTLEDTLSTLNNTHLNQIIKHLSILSILILSSTFIFGFILELIYLIYEGITLGFLLNAFINYKKIKGIYYFIVYFITTKLIYIIILSYIIYLTYKYVRMFIYNNYKLTNINGYLIRCIISTIIIFINDIIIYYIGNNLIDIFI